MMGIVFYYYQDVGDSIAYRHTTLWYLMLEAGLYPESS